MGSENTSEFEVRKPKLRKQPQRNVKSEASQKINNTTGDANNDESIITNKRKNRKRRTAAKNTNDNNVKTEIQEDISTAEINQNDNESINDKKTEKKRTRMESSTSEKVNHKMEHEEVNTEINTESTNVSKQPSKRQLKREKLEQRETEKIKASRLEAMQKGLNYVSKWKHARSEWKFEKLRQIWLMDNLLDEEFIPDSIFPVVLEYFEGCKGMAREQLLRKGMDVIKKAEEDEENRDSIMESIAYKRARQLLQALPTDR